MQAVLKEFEATKKLICVLFNADALPVVITGRDLIHQGWQLLNHPLYGNFRPYQQPFRSLLLQSPAQKAISEPHIQSLTLIEEALLVYSSNPVLSPKTAPAALTDDYSALDCELMRLTLEQAGVLNSGFVVSKKGH